MQPALFDNPGLSVDVSLNTGPQSARIASLFRSDQAFEELCTFVSERPHLLRRLLSADGVWVKPNITSGESEHQGRTTQPIVLDSVLRAIRALAPSLDVCVADSSVIGCSTTAAAELAGLLPICKLHGVRFLDLRDIPFARVPVPNHLEFECLEISEPFLNPRCFSINLAKIKSTYGSPVGFCIKNNKGLIRDETKLQFHLTGLQRALCDLGRSISWDLSILEAFPSSELGVPGPSGCFVAATHPVLADVVTCLALKVPLAEVFHLEWLSRFYQISVDDLAATLNHKGITELFPPLRYTRTAIRDLEEQYAVQITAGCPCTGCLESIAKALKRLGKAGVARRDIVLGAGMNQPLPCDKKHRKFIFVGNCSFDRCAMELVRQDYPDVLIEIWGRSAKVKGCPPTIDAMARSLAPRKRSSRNSGPSERIEAAFEIVPLGSLATARRMADIAPVVPPEEITFEEFDRETRLGCELVTAAICHQMNWDFLRRALREHVCAGANWWQLPQIGSVSSTVVDDLLRSYERPERVRAQQRAEMLRSLGVLYLGGKRSYSDVVPPVLVNERDRGTLLGLLEQCRVFSEDIERKKLQVAIHRFAQSGLVLGIDSLSRPAIDYHIMRLYLRRGEVRPVSALGLEYLTSSRSKRRSTVAALRRTVSSALLSVAEMCNIPIAAVNGIEWWIGRSVCVRNRPDCLLEGPDAQWLRPRFSRCPFAETCVALNVDQRLLSVREPNHVSRVY
jgi:uncharacterized protein (DUF362 family)